jgi:GNAT superfamily N-acetyltransferase
VSRSRSRPALELEYRPARREDLAACTRLWDIAIGDYVRRMNQPWFPGELEPLERLLAHLLETDPEGFRVAVRPGEDAEPVAFVSAHRRGRLWFLSMLFVHPDVQSRGVGRQLLEQVLPPPAERAGLALATATDSGQPISNAMYAEYGIVPRVPVWRLIGRVARPEELHPLPADVKAEVLPDTSAVPAEVDAIDRAVVGYSRPDDHAFLLGEGRLLVLYRRGAEVVGYGYTSQVGRVGPLAALDPGLLAPIGGHLLTIVNPAGAFAAWVPGSAGPLTSMLLRAGLRFEPFPMLFCWSEPLADFERYVPISGALV